MTGADSVCSPSDDIICEGGPVLMRRDYTRHPTPQDQYKFLGGLSTKQIAPAPCPYDKFRASVNPIHIKLRDIH
jgi:hypothetical protein